jgi:excisionase family DNA binding protein
MGNDHASYRVPLGGRLRVREAGVTTSGVGGRRERLLRSHEVGELLGVTPKTVALWARTGKLAATTTAGGHRRFRRSDVDAILAQRERR